MVDKPPAACYDLAMETNTDTKPQAPARRRRSDNVGWGSIPRLVNAERAARDRARSAKIRAIAPRSR